MKQAIHPKWYPEAKVVCVCGHIFTIGSTKAEIEVEVCSACHPFFTGEMKYVDVQGRVEKFQAKQKSNTEAYLKKKERRRLKRLQEEKEAQKKPQTLKEIFDLEKKKEKQRPEKKAETAKKDN